MALFRPTTISYHRPAPAGAGPYGPKCSKGEAMEGGKLRPGFKRKKAKASNWYGQYRDHNGDVKRVPLCPDRDKARQLLAKIITEDRLTGAGLTDKHADQRGRPLTEHIGDFLKYLAAKGNTELYVTATGQHIRKVAEGCGFKVIGDITPGRVMDFLAEQRRQGMSASTSNHYLRSCKGFSTWLTKPPARTREDVLKHLSTLNTEADRRHVRRAISDEEFAALLDAAKAGETYRGLDGPGRYVLYLLAAGTGYRCGELSSLTPASFKLGKAPTLTVEAGYSKRRRRDEIPLNSGLLPVLAGFLDGKEAGLPVFGGWWREKAAEMLRGDLQAARAAWIAKAKGDERQKREASDFLKYRDSADHVFDFHALRGQFATFLGRAGVGLTTAQKLMRHSTPNLTANVYTHLGLSDLAAAVESVALPTGEVRVQTKTPPSLPLALAAVG